LVWSNCSEQEQSWALKITKTLRSRQVVASDSPVNITTLPNELISVVASYLDFVDFLKLRRTGKDVATALDDIFLNTYFKFRAHALTLYSLETLVAITEVPRIAAKIQELHLAALSRDPPNLTGEQRWLEGERAKSIRLRTAEELKAELEVLDGPGLHGLQALLTTILGNIAASGHKFDLTLTQFVCQLPGNWEVFGVRHVRRSMAWVFVGNFSTDSYNSAVNKLLTAIATLSPKVRSLSLPGEVHTRSSKLQDHRLWTGMDHSVTTLTSLRLCLSKGSRGELMMYVCRLLEAATNLEHLELADECGSFPHIGRAMESKTLKTLKMGHFSTGPQELIEFLRKYESTLQEVFLYNISSTRWHEVLTFTRDRVGLEKLILHAIRCEEGTLMKSGRSTGRVYHCFDGKEKVKKGVDAVLAKDGFVWR
jgi:hypothetical protein